MSDEALVLCLYAGGTIGMVRQDANSGFAPYPSFLTETLRSQSRFHDPNGDSIFSWSDSVDRYKAWSDAYTHSGSGAATPASKVTLEEHQIQENIKQASLAIKEEINARKQAEYAKYNQPNGDNGHMARLPPTSAKSPLNRLQSDSATLPAGVTNEATAPQLGITPFGHPVLVRSSDPKATSTHHAISSQLSADGKSLELQLPTLITPRGANGKRVRYAVLEYDPLLDSSEMDIPDWIRLSTDISLNYKNFDSFIVLHGTDTMAYTSSALSMLLENLGKSVIVTGAQVPLSELRNDAIENVLGALTVAGSCIIPEVCLYFASTLYRGNRTSKVSNNALAAFDSPNMAPLARVGINIDVSWNLVERSRQVLPFRAHDRMSPNVAVLRLFPGLSTATVRSFLSPPLQGMVLESYGAGNAPSRKDLLDVFREASDRGVIIVNITQCTQGEVSAIYAVGKKLEAVGVVAGGDMTPECALAKLSYLLGKPELTPAQVRQLMAQPLRGELTPTRNSLLTGPSPSTPFLGKNADMKSLLAHILQNPTNAPSPLPLEAETDDPDAVDSVSHEVTRAALTILPYLIHNAAASNNLNLLTWHLHALNQIESIPSFSLSSDHVPEPRSSAPLEKTQPLHIAAARGYTDIVEALLKAGCSVHARENCSGFSVLFLALRKGHQATVKLLKDAGAHLREEEAGLVNDMDGVKNAEMH
ncbi:hypothetical protein MBLNU457_g1071t1 [Dothideomycetes sp. NU457]